MGRTTRQVDGDLVRAVAERDRGLYGRPRGARPRPGTTVTLWRLDGSWVVQSPAPEAGTWWLRATGPVAKHLVAALAERPDRGAPVVRAVWRDCIAVLSKEIRPAALGGAR